MNTRPIRAVIAAMVLVALTLLLGCGNSEVASIERVLQADATTAPGATSVGQVVARMRAIDLDGCPNDFKSAYLAHIHAWEGMELVEQEAKTWGQNYNTAGAVVESFIRGFLLDPLGKYNEGVAAQNQLQRNYQSAAHEVRETFNRVETIAVARGAKLAK